MVKLALTMMNHHHLHKVVQMKKQIMKSKMKHPTRSMYHIHVFIFHPTWNWYVNCFDLRFLITFLFELFLIFAYKIKCVKSCRILKFLLFILIIYSRSQQKYRQSLKKLHDLYQPRVHKWRF